MALCITLNFIMRDALYWWAQSLLQQKHPQRLMAWALDMTISSMFFASLAYNIPVMRLNTFLGNIRSSQTTVAGPFNMQVGNLMEGVPFLVLLMVLLKFQCKTLKWYQNFLRASVVIIVFFFFEFFLKGEATILRVSVSTFLFLKWVLFLQWKYFTGSFLVTHIMHLCMHRLR